MTAFKTYLKYKRVKKAAKMHRYSLFMLQLAKNVEQSRVRQAQAMSYQQVRQKSKLLVALQAHTQHRQVKKAKLAKAARFARSKLKQNALRQWAHQVAAMKRIRGDKLLWQAHTSNSDFFSVSVKVGSTMDYKQKTSSLT